MPVRYLALTLPGGVLGLYDEVGTPAPERRLPDAGVNGDDVARWLAAAPRYGLQIVGGPIGRERKTSLGDVFRSRWGRA